jgi:hypothetical protein
MYSKRGNAKGKSQKQKSPMKRTQRSRAGPKPKGKRNTVAVRSQTARVSAPLNEGRIKQRFFGMKFGAAAPHDEYPEGGLRISGMLPSSEGVLTQGNTSSTFGMLSGGSLASAFINPTGSATTTTSATLFSSTGPLAVFAQYFRKFRFRQLGLEVSSEIPPGAITAAAGSGLIVQVSHESDAATAGSLSSTYTEDTAVTSSNCVRFPVWTPEIICPVIQEGKTDRSDLLYFVEPDSEDFTSAATIRQANQGAVLVVGSKLNGTGTLVTSKVLLRFSVDLYGFSNVAAGAIALMIGEGKSRRSAARSREFKADSKNELSASEPIELRPLALRREPTLRPGVVGSFDEHYVEVPPSTPVQSFRAVGSRVSSNK